MRQGLACAVCNRPVNDDEAVPREYPDPRFPSGLVKLVRWVHPGACETTVAPPPAPRAA